MLVDFLYACRLAYLLWICLSPCGFASRLASIIAYLFIFLQWWWYLSSCCKVSKQDENPWKSCLFPCFSEQRELLYSSCSEKAPFVVHKITIDYAFDQVFRAKMLSLHENFAPQILVFRHELPFFPSYFVWNPFCFCRGFLFVVDSFCFCRGFVFAVESFLFLSWICSAVDAFVYIPSSFLFLSFLLSFLQFSPTKSEKRGSFLGKSPSFFWKSPSFFGGYSLTSSV